MSSITFTKAKAVAEDIEWGLDEVEQTRNGVLYTYNKINAKHVPYSSTETIYDKLVALEGGTAQSLKYVYEAEAQKRTARSYAIEPENVEVKSYTSNGDGSFSVVSLTGVYSALHYEAKADGNLDLQNWEAEASKMTAESYATETTDVIVYTSNGDGTFTDTVQIGVSSAVTLSLLCLAYKDSAATSEENAGLSEENAGLSAAAAGLSETAAGLSETAAALSEANASTSATNANIDRLAIEAIYDQYDDRYLGSKATDPALDNDGNPLLAGATYWNTTNGLLMFYNGATWESPDLSASQSATAALASKNASAASATAAQLLKWEAEAWELTAYSYATEAEDVLTKLVTSDGDGTFTYTPTTKYSALHWAATSEENAGLSAAAAGLSETAAGLSETAAALSEANASTSATNANIDRLAIEAIYDQYDDRYLGSKATDPALDNDGNPLLAGATYWNTTNGLLMFYNGATWESPDLSASQSATAALASKNASAASATAAQLLKWEAEAWELTAYSYATEAEDVLTKLVTSDGDGTFTYTPTTKYSALHWAAKVALFNPSLYAPISSPALTDTPTAPTPVAGTNTTQLATTAFVERDFIKPTDYATSTVGGTVKARISGSTLYLTINGATA
jgi:predicted DNA-binding protein